EDPLHREDHGCGRERGRDEVFAKPDTADTAHVRSIPFTSFTSFRRRVPPPCRPRTYWRSSRRAVSGCSPTVPAASAATFGTSVSGITARSARPWAAAIISCFLVAVRGWRADVAGRRDACPAAAPGAAFTDGEPRRPGATGPPSTTHWRKPRNVEGK